MQYNPEVPKRQTGWKCPACKNNIGSDSNVWEDRTKTPVERAHLHCIPPHKRKK